MIAQIFRPVDIHFMAQIPTASLLNTAIEGIAVAALVWTLLRLAGRLNSGTRFAVWFASLLAIAALPFFSATHSTSNAAGAPIHIPTIWATYLFGAWVIVSAGFFARLGLGLWQVRKLRRDATRVAVATLPSELRDLFQQDQTGRAIELCVSDKVEAPAAFGFLRPAIMVPAWALTDLPAEELRVILLHELAHLRRYDDWTNLVQKMVKALFFFHPAIWWIEGRLALEREMACDDLVLAQTVNPKAYAASLISFAEKMQRGRELALAHSVVGRVRQISYRIARILDSNRPRATRIWKPVLGVVTLLSAAALVAAPYAPQLVAFENPSTPVSAQLKTILSSGQQQARHNVVPAKLRMKTTPTPAMIPARAKVRANTPRVMRASFHQQQAPVLVYMQQTHYPNAVWTLCVWQVSSSNGTQRRVETLVVHSI